MSAPKKLSFQVEVVGLDELVDRLNETVAEVDRLRASLGLPPVADALAPVADVPIVPVPNAEDWASGYRWGQQLEETFPNQDAADFAMALSENEPGPTVSEAVTSLVMVKQGERDEGSWVWHVGLADGSLWNLEGWCDYTGWDCQSGVEWTQLSSPAALPSDPEGVKG